MGTTALRNTRAQIAVYFHNQPDNVRYHMGRKVDVDQLIGADGIAERLHLSRAQVVHVWRARHDDFPTPVYQRGRAILWYWPDVERWARRTGRL
jgi:hypothetical protein